MLITSDDQTKLELKWMPQTRQLLGQAGLTFNNMIAPHPNCCPARAQILTGQYAQNNGVRTNSPPWGGHEGFDPTTALPVWLQEAGYRTGFIGKYMHGYDETDGIEPGWDQWKPIVGTLSDYRSFLQYDNGKLVQFGETDYYTDVVAQQSADLVTEFSGTGEPFFLWSSFIAPHGTCQGNTEADCSGPPPAADRHAEPARGRDAARRLTSPSFNEPDVTDKRKDIQEAAPVDPAAQQTSSPSACGRSPRWTRRSPASWPPWRPQARSTTRSIMFTSDNGYLFGEHRLVGKNVPYEESLRVPLVMRGPEIPAGRAPQADVAMVDLAPTIAELANAEPMVEIDGRSLLGYAVKDRRQRDRGLLLQAGSKGKDEETAWKWRGVRTKRYTLVRWQGPRFVELYDRTHRPVPARPTSRWTRTTAACARAGGLPRHAPGLRRRDVPHAGARPAGAEPSRHLALIPSSRIVEVLIGDVAVAEAAAGAIPTDGDPDGVADEAVDEVDVEIRSEHARGDAVAQQGEPDVARLGAALGEVAEPFEAAEVVGLVLEDRDLRGMLVDRLEREPHDPVELGAGVVVGGQHVVVRREQLVLEGGEDLVDHRLLGVEVVVEAAAEDAGRLGDVADRGVLESLVGEEPGGDLQQLAAPASGRGGVGDCHPRGSPGRGSRGRPSTRSARMLRWISSLPP